MLDFKRSDPAVLAAERDLAPREIYELMQTRPELASGFFLGPHFKNFEPSRFVRTPLADNAMFYSAHSGARRLVVCFTGALQRVMVPISGMLQFLDEDKADLLLLFDPEVCQFTRGVSGYAGSVPELVGRINKFAADGKYDAVFTYGTSLGAFPALRIGRLLGATRAISINGRFPWTIARLANGARVQAFDSLCGCVQSETRCFAVYSKVNGDDAESAKKLARMLPSTVFLATPFKNHNAVMQIYKAGCLRAFYEIVFGPRDPDQEALTGLFYPAPVSVQPNPARVPEDPVVVSGPVSRLVRALRSLSQG